MCIINEAMLPREIVEASPEGCDSETKSVEGVEGQDSVWSFDPSACQFVEEEQRDKAVPHK